MHEHKAAHAATCQCVCRAASVGCLVWYASSHPEESLTSCVLTQPTDVSHCLSLTHPAGLLTQEDSEQQRRREHRFWQSRLADLVTCMRQRAANPVTVEETEAMDAVELLDLSQVSFILLV